VCEAKLVNTIGVLPTSRLEEQRTKRLDGQLKRLERHGDEARLRRMDAVTADDQGAAIEALAQEALPAPGSAPAGAPEPDTTKPTATGKPSGDVIDIDILTWRPD